MSFLSASFIEGKSDIGFMALNIKEENPNGDTVTLKITLTNNSPDTLKYESKSCSWQDYYRTASKKWAVLKEECFINGHINKSIYWDLFSIFANESKRWKT